MAPPDTDLTQPQVSQLPTVQVGPHGNKQDTSLKKTGSSRRKSVTPFQHKTLRYPLRNLSTSDHGTPEGHDVTGPRKRTLSDRQSPENNENKKKLDKKITPPRMISDCDRDSINVDTQSSTEIINQPTRPTIITIQ